MSGIEINDAKAAMTEANRAVVRNPQPCLIGPAVEHRVAHPAQHVGVSVVTLAEDPNDSAHLLTASSRS